MVFDFWSHVMMAVVVVVLLLWWRFSFDSLDDVHLKGELRVSLSKLRILPLKLDSLSSGVVSDSPGRSLLVQKNDRIVAKKHCA